MVSAVSAWTSGTKPSPLTKSAFKFSTNPLPSVVNGGSPGLLTSSRRAGPFFVRFRVVILDPLFDLPIFKLPPLAASVMPLMPSTSSAVAPIIARNF
ncbi:unannotated protein [freshwater metagenome]|uniref:Unannotated protein n=1 Tax=freshwater metagenome TaxID=449393 RepID=A0A6J5ZJ67_9ZZZZ